MIPWGFAIGALIAVVVYAATGWVVFAWRSRSPDLDYLRNGFRNNRRNGDLPVDDVELAELIVVFATRAIEAHERLESDAERSALSEWRAIHRASSAIVAGQGADPGGPGVGD